jgi:hypothetical protein
VLFLLFANPFPEIWDKVPKKFSEPLNRLTVDYRTRADRQRMGAAQNAFRSWLIQADSPAAP